MRGQTLRVQTAVELFTEECCHCGVLFGMTAAYQQERRADHRFWYCPNGHSQHYTGESDAEKNARLLREEQARHQRTLTRANEAESKLTTITKRVARGVCPCCNRTFKQLSAHMTRKHPGFAT